MVLSSEWLCVTSHFSLAKCLSSKSKCLPSFYPNQAPWSSCLGGSIWDAFTVDKIIQLQDFLLEFYKEEQLLSLLLLVFQETKLSLRKKKIKKFADVSFLAVKPQWVPDSRSPCCSCFWLLWQWWRGLRTAVRGLFLSFSLSLNVPSNMPQCSF